VQGACRRHELCDLTVNDIEDKGDMLLVKIPKTKNDKPRSFVVTDNFYHIPGHFFNSEHSPYLFPMFSFKKHRSMHVCNHVTKATKIST
jgi:integrase